MNDKLRIWWTSNTDKIFYVETSSIKESIKILNILSQYNEFQYKNKFIDENNNSGGIQIYTNNDWYSLDIAKKGLNECIQKET